MAKQQKRWTSEEVELLVQAVKNNPYNLLKGFREVAKETGRTPESVSYKWYRNVRYTTEGRKAMLTISKDSSYTGKLYYPRVKVKPVKVSLPKKVWITLVNFATNVTKRK